MSNLPKWKIVIFGDGTQNPPYKWELFRRSMGGAFAAAPLCKGTASSKGDCTVAAYERAKAEAIRERSAETREEVEFDVMLEEPDTDVLDEIPVAEPERDLRMERRND